MFITSCRQAKLTESKGQSTVPDSTGIQIVKQQAGPYFLLKNSDDKLSLNKFEEDTIVAVGQYNVNSHSIYTTDGKSRLAVLDNTNNCIRLYDIDIAADTVLDIPYQLNASCILMNEEYIFVGGGLQDEMLIGYHLESKQWLKLEIPDNMRFPGKEIDDLLLNGNLLIAIDNIITPKYVLFYRLDGSSKTDLVDVKRLKHNGTYESIKKGRLSAKYFGLMSSTSSGYSGQSSHVTVYRGLDLKEGFSLSTHERGQYGYLTINDFSIVNETVWIAYKEKGLGKLLIDDRWLTRDAEDTFVGNARVDISNIQFEAFPNEEIEHLTLIPNTNKVILTIKKAGTENRRFEIKE